MAQDLAAGGADLAAVMQAVAVAVTYQGSTMPARYVERLLAKRGAVAGYYSRRG